MKRSSTFFTVSRKTHVQRAPTARIKTVSSESQYARAFNTMQSAIDFCNVHAGKSPSGKPTVCECCGSTREPDRLDWYPAIRSFGRLTTLTSRKIMTPGGRKVSYIVREVELFEDDSDVGGDCE